jgi:hypothetical protein
MLNAEGFGRPPHPIAMHDTEEVHDIRDVGVGAAVGWVLGAVVLLTLVVLLVAKAAAPAHYALDQTRAVRSGVDGAPYRVHLVHRSPDRAADTMAALNFRAVELMRHLRDRYLRGPKGYPERERATRRLLSLYNPDNLAENSPQNSEKDTSYTVDKGAIVALCLRGRSGGGIHDLETLTFVLIHELTHIAIEAPGHPQRFWRVFRFLLEEAWQARLLRGVNYMRTPTVYCGIGIDYNPLYDPALAPAV